MCILFYDTYPGVTRKMLRLREAFRIITLLCVLALLQRHIWTCTLKLTCLLTADQVQGVMEETGSDSSVKDFQVEKKLLGWCQNALDG